MSYKTLLASFILMFSCMQPLQWSKTTHVGCAMTSCPRLPLDDGNKVLGTLLFVCKYLPAYFSRVDGQLYKEGPCLSSSCPTDVPNCVPFEGSVGGEEEEDKVTGLYCGESGNSLFGQG